MYGHEIVAMQQCLQVMSCYEPDTTITAASDSHLGNLFCVLLFLTILSTSKKGGCGI